ncbi:MFS transporter [Nicoliella spurrieriana]|uniref:MFS transporter n=1 Tax=Nicoliella spurrieriana TaxID=2925830 RepID=A0A976RR04_9LACO|nr:MFS transporter [Nicoliella spurrieriana]UQS86239.1 MFS transporter [Nicoliella spurrieriana]
MDDKRVPIKTVLAIIAVALVSFSGIMAETSMNVTFTTLAQTFGSNLNTIQWVTAGYLLAVTIAITTSAYTTKRFSIRAVWLVSILLFIVGSLVGACALNLPMLILGRVLEGTASGIAMPLSFNIVIYTVPSERIGTWLGFSSLVVSLAPSFGPSYGGLILDHFGWRAIFIILLIAPALSLMMGWQTINHIDNRSKTSGFDWGAFSLFAIILMTSLLLVNQFEQHGFNWPLGILMVVAIVALVWHYQHSRKSFLNFTLFRQGRFLALLVPVALYMFSMLGLNLIIPTLAENELHTSSFIAGFALLPGALTGALLNPYFGRMYDHRGGKLPMYLGNWILLGAVSIMATFKLQWGLSFLIGIYIVYIIGRNMAYFGAQTAAIDDQPPVNQSDATAIIQTFQMFMGSMGTTVGALFQTQFGILNGFKTFSCFSIGIAVVNGLLMWGYYRSKKRSR